MFLSAFNLAIRAIQRNLLRSFLTVLGVVIGVAAVITMVTLGNGATQMVSDQISSLGSNLILVRPGQRIGPGRDSAGSPQFKKSDIESIRSQINGVEELAPMVGSAATLVAGSKNWAATISGTTNAYLKVGNWKIASGRDFMVDEDLVGKSVCIIGATIRRELFGNRNPIGDSIRIKTFSCQIIGLLAEKGQGAMGIDQDDIVLMPINTVQRRLKGNTDISIILISLRDGVNGQAVMHLTPSQKSNTVQN